MKNDWKFSGDISLEFQDHISKSIPNYEKIQEYVISFSEYICFEGAKVLDIGCSTGYTLANLENEYKNRKLKLVGCEIEKDMVKVSLDRVKDKGIEIKNEDFEYMNSDEKFDLLISIFTLQFLNPPKRKRVINKIYDHCSEGGYFLFSEKVISKDSFIENVMSSILRENKINNGISEKDVIEKEKSLRGVMHCIKEDEIYKEMKNAGFSSVELLIKENSFALFIAKK